MNDSFVSSYRSIEHASQNDFPFHFWVLQKFLPENVLEEVLNLNFPVHNLKYDVGNREENNQYRHRFVKEAQDEYPIVKEICDFFQSKKTIQAWKEMCGQDLTGNFLRIEYIQDQDGFWLKSHTDVGAKKFTFLIQLVSPYEDEKWGTDLYKDEFTFYQTIDFVKNNGFVFIPSYNTWHAVGKRHITGVRKMLMVNYVSDEWENTQELCFPDQPVSLH